MKRNTLSIIGLFILTIIWGSAFVFQDLASEHVSSFTFNMLRFGIASIVLTPIFLFISGKKQKEVINSKKNVVIGSLLCGIFMVAASVLQQLGIQTTAIGKSGFITATYILIIPILSLFLNKRYTLNVYLAILLACGGLYLLCINGSFAFEIGDIYLILSAFCYSLQIMVVEYFANKINPIILSLGQSLVSFILCIIPSLIIDQPTISQIINALLPILYVAVFSTSVGYTLQIVCQRDVNPTLASLIMSLESVFSVIFGAIFLEQFLSEREFMGCLIMFIAIILAQLPSSWFKLKRCKKVEEK